MSRSDVMERVTALMVYVEGEQALPNMRAVLLLQEKYFSEGTRGCNEREEQLCDQLEVTFCL